MFYKIAKILSKTAIVFGFMCMVGGCSVEQQEFLVTIEGADKATTLYYSQTGVWFDEQGEPYKVVAWMPLPEVFRG